MQIVLLMPFSMMPTPTIYYYIHNYKENRSILLEEINVNINDNICLLWCFCPQHKILTDSLLFSKFLHFELKAITIKMVIFHLCKFNRRGDLFDETILDRFLDTNIQDLKDRGLYNEIDPLESANGPVITIGGKKLLNL